MDYKKKYEQALERAKKFYNRELYAECNGSLVEYIFPELKECEDERIKRDIQYAVRCAYGDNSNETNSIFAWLEKKGEQKQHLELKAGHWYFCHQAYCERADILTVKEGETFKCEKDGIVKGLIIKEPEKYFREISTPTDKVEPKFKVGDWVRAISSGNIFKILSVNDELYRVLCYDGVEANYPIIDVEKHLTYWTIQDAKEGDVLCDYYEAYNIPLIFILKKFERVNFGFAKPSDYSSYCFLTAGDKQRFKEGNYHHKFNIKPATKEQRDLLFQKMKEAGYEWDSEKKELKKINLNKAEHGKYYFCIKDYFSGGKKFASKGDVVQALRGLPIMGLEDVSEYFIPVNNVHNYAWSEEDEDIRDKIIRNYKRLCGDVNIRPVYKEEIDWLKSLKDRIQQLPKQEWGEEDKLQLNAAIQITASTGHTCTSDWLSSLKERYTWKPSDEQMEVLNWCKPLWKEPKTKAVLESLIEDLKKMKGE